MEREGQSWSLAHIPFTWCIPTLFDVVMRAKRRRTFWENFLTSLIACWLEMMWPQLEANIPRGQVLGGRTTLSRRFYLSMPLPRPASSRLENIQLELHHGELPSTIYYLQSCTMILSISETQHEHFSQQYKVLSSNATPNEHGNGASR